MKIMIKDESLPPTRVPVRKGDEASLAKLMAENGLTHSVSESRRLIGQRAVKLNGEIVDDISTILQASQLPAQIQVGMRNPQTIQNMGSTSS